MLCVLAIGQQGQDGKKRNGTVQAGTGQDGTGRDISSMGDIALAAPATTLVAIFFFRLMAL